MASIRWAAFACIQSPSRGALFASRIGASRGFSCSATWRQSAAAVEEISEESVPTMVSPDEVHRLRHLRNVGISAHIDSGKTTLTERVLFYTGRIKEIHEVRGRDNVGAKMDSMELEREKGITIQSAATFCDWDKKDLNGSQENYKINIIDTPGHVDFTIEVERALRVLDGAVLVLCAVSGVQSQTITVDRQMKRYNVPRISFVNKMDRAGANPFRIVDQIRQKLRIPCAPVQVPIGAESDFKGVVDLLKMKALYNEGPRGVNIREDEIPSDVLELAQKKRIELIEQLADVDDYIAEKFLNEEEPTTTELRDAIRRATIARKFTPLLMGSAIKDTGIQHVLDAVCDYLPNPTEVTNMALDQKKEEAPVTLVPYSTVPLVGLAFKLEEGRYGQLTYMRIYQGKLNKGGYIYNIRTGKKLKVPRLVRMHSNEMEDIDSIAAGEICALFGVECSSGDTFTDGTVPYTMTSMFVPEPVISLSLTPKGKETTNFSKALNRFQREDPTFRVHLDPESKETIISGMGELHLDIYVERMRREYNVECVTGKPQVAFREALTKRATFNYTHKKQTGGAGQFGRVQGYIEPITVEEVQARIQEAAIEGLPAPNPTDSEFNNRVIGGNIPTSYIPAVEKGFREGLDKGLLIGHPVNSVRFALEDGSAHSVDSSELAFRLAGLGAFRDVYHRAGPVVLEPIMTVEVTAPVEFQGSVIGGLNRRKGSIADTEVHGEDFTVTAEVPLESMFGYSTELRGMTQGKGEFSMEYLKHERVASHIEQEMILEYRKKQQEKSK